MEKRIYPEPIESVVSPEPCGAQKLHRRRRRPSPRCRRSTTATPASCATPSPALADGGDRNRRYRAFYPEVGVTTSSYSQVDSRQAYGHMPTPGHFTTTITRPDLFETLSDRAARASSCATTACRSSSRNRETPIPLHFAFLEGTHVDGVGRRPHQAADPRPVRRAGSRRHRRPDRQRHLRGRCPASRGRWRRSPRSASTIRCTGCRTTRRPARSISRTSCCSPTTSSTSTSSASTPAS